MTQTLPATEVPAVQTKTTGPSVGQNAPNFMPSDTHGKSITVDTLIVRESEVMNFTI
ncbi:MAG TPA: hypothetical protein VL122_07005 [Nitrospirota bacterium]|nr:hypothetical protein [Nitrospirota bacterium]